MLLPGTNTVCTYQTSHTGTMRRHKAAKHNVTGLWITGDGKRRNKQGMIIHTCGVNGCTYETAQNSHMKNHKASKHGIGKLLIPQDYKPLDNQRDHQGYGIGDCTFKTGSTSHMKNHKGASTA